MPRFLELLVNRIRDDFARWNEFNKSPRTAIHSIDGVIELMPISDGSRFCFKFVNGHPKNYFIGLPTVMAFGVLAEVDTGWPIILSEMTFLTALRTAATSVVAAQALANIGPKSMAVIGNGAQSEFQILAFHYSMGVSRINLFDISAQASQKALANLKHVAGLELLVHDSGRAAVENSEIVTTSTASKARVSVLTADMIEPGMHINAIGGDCPGKTEIDPEVLERARVFVEFDPQTRVEGEIQQMLPSFPVTELWQVLAGQSPGRTSPADITLFDSVGFSIEDFSTLNLVYELARSHELGTEIELIPNIEDARNLYGSLVQGLSPMEID